MENYPAYLDMVMDNKPEQIRKELDRLMTKIMKAQDYYAAKGGCDEEIRAILFY